MKKQAPFLLAAIIILAVSQQLQAQTYTGNLNLTTQAEVNAFNYTEVTGWLNIHGTDITDLSPLSNLVSVDGQLFITNTSLTTIDGFSSLTTAGEILISENPVLQSFSDFHSLVSTLGGGNIEISNNVSLTSFSGFEVLQTVGWSFEISYNTVLTQIPDYPLLHTIASSLFIYDNPSLPEITGFNTLQSIGWAFFINENNALTGITGFKVLQSIAFYPWPLFNPPIIITDNDVLADFCGLYYFFNYNSGLYTGTNLVDISGNLVNPSIQDIINGGPCPGCPQPQGDWKNNPDWPVAELMLGTQSYTQAELVDILNTPVGRGMNADASLILANQLIASKLNIANGAEASQEVQDAIASADELIGSETIPMGVQPRSTQGKQMTNVAGFLTKLLKFFLMIMYWIRTIRIHSTRQHRFDLEFPRQEMLHLKFITV
ncbi:MAG: hypothetical protein P8X73_18365 [Ignavibacteriaceae bacterium]